MVLSANLSQNRGDSIAVGKFLVRYNVLVMIDNYYPL